MKLKLILLVVVALSGGAQAQEPKSREQSDDQQQAVVNDDGGRAFVVGSESALLNRLTKTGPVISEPQQYSIFLGSSWATPKLRAREPELANLLANIRDQATQRALLDDGVRNLFGATFSQEKLNDFDGNRDVSDLQVQAVLAAMLKDGTLSGPNRNTIYVVFLGPGLQSTLGSMIGRKHYLAYHSFFNTSGAKLHYVVVPFEPDRRAAQDIALRAFLTAILNP